MKTLVVLLLTVLLYGCSTTNKLTAAKPKFPDPYIDESTKQIPKCETLKVIPPDVNNMSSVFKIIVDNYTLYWQCSNKVEGWRIWYEIQKRNYESK